MNTPAPVRKNAPATSVAAAKSVVTGKQRVQVLTILRDAYPNGLTDDEMRTEGATRGMPMSPSGSRTRRSELVDMGFVQDSGNRSASQFGRSAIVWEITSTGIAELT
jgi:hypothetical protein